jgi:hypothetical protein
MDAWLGRFASPPALYLPGCDIATAALHQLPDELHHAALMPDNGQAISISLMSG